MIKVLNGSITEDTGFTLVATNETDRKRLGRVFRKMGLGTTFRLSGVVPNPGGNSGHKQLHFRDTTKPRKGR